MAGSNMRTKSRSQRKSTSKAAPARRSAPKSLRGVPVPGHETVSPTAKPGKRPRPEMPVFRHSAYGLHGMFGVVSGEGSNSTNPMAGEMRVQHSLTSGTAVSRFEGKARVSYAVPVAVSSASMQVFFRGVRVTYGQSYSYRVDTKQWYAPLRGVMVWDGTRKIGELLWPVTVYKKNLEGAVQSAWFLRGPVVREPITQGLTITVASDFTVDEKAPMQNLSVRFLDVEIATLAVGP